MKGVYQIGGRMTLNVTEIVVVETRKGKAVIDEGKKRRQLQGNDKNWLQNDYTKEVVKYDILLKFYNIQFD